MKTQHVHAAVIHAYADGAKVQILNTAHNEWADTNSPDFYPDQQYRIKPEPKPDVHWYANVFRTGLGADTSRLSDCQNYAGSLGILKITINGETQQVSAEVV